MGPEPAQLLLIGRDAERQRLEENVARGRHTLLVGPIGIGKSHLLRVVARALPRALHIDHVRPIRMSLLALCQTLILQLDRGGALRLVTSALEDLGYTWAYRVIDAECFGVPQRRRRWFLVASRGADPRPIVLVDQVKPQESPPENEVACGFYWTEGMRALGWAVDAVPPIKVGSALGVASPPAMLFPDGSVATPDIRDAERLQGFPPDWTLPAETVARPGFRWQLVGNAVCVPVSAWLGQRFLSPGTYDGSFDSPVSKREPWPYAAWSLERGKVFKSEANDWPVWLPRPHLQEFLQYPVKPLSPRAAAGFLKRAGKGTLRLPSRLIRSLEALAARFDSQAGIASRG